MTLNILSNSAANRALTSLQMSSDESTKSVGKLASGSRVVTAADDAASYSLGTKVGTEASALKVAVSNAGQAISVLQTADQSMGRLQEVLTRMRTLATRAGAENISNTERVTIDVEYQKLADEVSRVTKDVKLNGVALLASEFQNGGAAATGVTSGFGLTEGGTAGAGGGVIQNISVRGFDNRAQTLGGEGPFIAQISHGAPQVGADLQFTLRVVRDDNGNGAIDGGEPFFDKFATIDGSLLEPTAPGAAPPVTLATGVTLAFLNPDTTNAEGISDFTVRNASVTISILPDGGFSFGGGGGGIFDNGAANVSQFVIDEDTTGLSSYVSYDFKMGTGIIADEDNINVRVGGVTLEQLGVTNTNVVTKSAADAAAGAIDGALEFLVGNRSDVGGSIAQIETATDNIAIGVERNEGARSRFVDLNVASEITKFTNEQVFFQSGISTMAQSNQLTQNLLRLFA